jgi:putative transposase
VRQQLSAPWQWQPGSFDRLLRSDESAEEKWQYIRENPVRAGLVEKWQDWPYRIGFEL